MKPLRNSPIFRKQTERTQDEKTASMGRNAAQKVTKTAKNRAANEELRLYRLGVLHEIRTSDCSKTEQDRLLKELHMEVNVL